MGYTYEHPRMAVTVDVALFAADGAPDILLIQRGKEPFAGKWALPGGFVDMDERAADAAARELAEEAGVEGVRLAFLDYFDAIDRDPRGRTLSLTFEGVTRKAEIPIRADDDAQVSGKHKMRRAYHPGPGSRHRYFGSSLASAAMVKTGSAAERLSRRSRMPP